jgi:hypothetical protein
MMGVVTAVIGWLAVTVVLGFVFVCPDGKDSVLGQCCWTWTFPVWLGPLVTLVIIALAAAGLVCIGCMALEVGGLEKPRRVSVRRAR